MDGGRIAERLHSLMSALGYERYGVQGGDWGAIIDTGLALRHPEAVLGLHLNMVAGTGGVAEGVTPSPAEQEYLEFRDGWEYENQGYDHIESTRPRHLPMRSKILRSACWRGSWRSSGRGRTTGMICGRHSTATWC
jgi:pimeloyl-ACP methyl ester carboxylesterase